MTVARVGPLDLVLLAELRPAAVVVPAALASIGMLRDKAGIVLRTLLRRPLGPLSMRPKRQPSSA
jgi:hypothetical protein